MIAAALTSVAGSSEWFEYGFVTYGNAAKTDLLGVPVELLTQYGAVSREVVAAMAEGARQRAAADVAVAVTGIAGPDGGSTEKPVGSVWLAWAIAGRPTATRLSVFSGDREAVRVQTTATALGRALELICVP